MVCPCCVSPPPPCDECEECDFPFWWPSFLFEQGGAIECFGTTTQNSTRGQDIFRGASQGLPSGVSWKAGYPAALIGCEYALVIDSLSIDCCYENCDGEFPSIGAGKTRNRYRILLLTCPDGPESAQITDITDLAIEGDLEFETDQKPAECPGPGTCTEWFDYFPDPEPACNPLP